MYRVHETRGGVRSGWASLVTLTALAALTWPLTGCSSPEFEAANARLDKSRLLFIQEDRFNIFAPPLFAGPGELDAHRNGAETYEKRFKAKFPPNQEQWLAEFKPLTDLGATLEAEKSALIAAAAAQEKTNGVASSAKPASAGQPAAGPVLTYYLVPLEGVDAALVRQVEATVKRAGVGCVPNAPGNVTAWPMPARGDARRPPPLKK